MDSVCCEIKKTVLRGFYRSANDYCSAEMSENKNVKFS